MVFHKLQTCKLQLLKTLNFIAGEFQRFLESSAKQPFFAFISNQLTNGVQRTSDKLVDIQ